MRLHAPQHRPAVPLAAPSSCGGGRQLLLLRAAASKRGQQSVPRACDVSSSPINQVGSPWPCVHANNRNPSLGHGMKATRKAVVAAAATVDDRPASAAPESTTALSLIRLSPPGVKAHGLLCYVPGTDGTGSSIIVQLPKLVQQGYEVWSLYTPIGNRQPWDELTASAAALLAQLSDRWHASHHDEASNGNGFRPAPAITLLGESFGGCLSLRVALTQPNLLKRLVLLNPATCYNDSLSGLSALIGSTNLLGVFPEPLYAAAQTTLLPLLVDSKRITPAAADLMRSMINMDPPRGITDRILSSDSTLSSAGALTFSTYNGSSYANGSSNGNGNGDDAYRAYNGDDSTQASGNGGGSSSALELWSSGSPLPSSLTDVPAALVSYGPAGAANWRINLLRTGNLSDAQLRSVTVPTLIITSARDRLIPSITEGARLLRVIPASVRTILPDSGHAALLEQNVDLAAILQQVQSSGPAVRAAAASAGASSLAVDGAASASWPSAGEKRMAPTAAAVATAAATATLTATGAMTASAIGFVEAAVPGSNGAGNGSNGSGSSSHNGSLISSVMNGSSNGTGKGRLTDEQRGMRTVGSGARAVTENENSDAWSMWAQRLAPWRDLVSPVVLGADNLPPVGSKAWSRPWLLVGNHGRMGVYDTPLLLYELYVRGHKARGLAHPGHWKGPLGPLFEQFGAVKASPMAAFRLLRNNEKVLLFPGGASEVVKRRGEEYQLLWRESPDFVRLATKCKAIIIPFAAVGADDAFDIAMEVDEVLEHPLFGPLVRSALQRVDPEGELKPRESFFPLTRLPVLGVPTPIPVPNLTRLYFKFGEPIDTADLSLDLNDEAACQQLYDGIRGTIKQDLAELLQLRESDGERDIQSRIAGAVSALFSTAQSVATSSSGRRD